MLHIVSEVSLLNQSEAFFLVTLRVLSLLMSGSHCRLRQECWNTFWGPTDSAAVLRRLLVTSLCPFLAQVVFEHRLRLMAPVPVLSAAHPVLHMDPTMPATGA